MSIFFRLGTFAAAAGLALAVSCSAAAQSDSERWGPQGKTRINAYTIGLASGLPEGAPLRIASELARALNEGENLRILPIVTRGIFDNFVDLLQLKGVDAAIVYGDTLLHFDKVEKVPNILDKVHYVASLFPSELQILVRPEINGIQDLAGKWVNFNNKGTAAAYTGPIVFQRLGIKVVERYDPHPVVMRQFASSDKYAATVWVTSKPVRGIAARPWPKGFKLISVPYTKELEDLYLPATLDEKDYPQLIGPGQKISTIAVPAVLAVYNWRDGQARRQRMERFVDYIFKKLPMLQKPPFHPAWRNVSLAATVPGWRRYQPVQDKLDQLRRGNRAASAQR
ncbi:MAG: C4-dicarboxylate ABC transporter substrate-binding protein [Hyphomicrobiaceae bacterium]